MFQLSWWQRFWRRLRHRKVRAAGDRPRNRRRAVGGSGPGWLTSWVTRIVVLIILVVVVLTFVGPEKKPIRSHLSRYYHDVTNTVHPTYNSVHPIGATATSAVTGHGPALAIDGASNTYWATNSPNNGIGQSITITLAKATNLDKLGFLLGDTDSPQAYLTQPRPEKIHVTFTGPSTGQDITLKDTAAFQNFGVSAKKVIALTITIESVYPAAQGQNTSLTEVELFSKS